MPCPVPAPILVSFKVRSPWSRTGLPGESLPSGGRVGRGGQLHVPVGGSHGDRGAGGVLREAACPQVRCVAM